MAKEDGKDDELDFSSQQFFMPRFNTLHNLAKEQLRRSEVSSAKETYSRMLSIYDQINKSQISTNDKQMAYGKLMYVFTALSNDEAYEPMTGIMPLAKYIVPASMVVLVLLIIFFVKPEFSLTGLVVADSNTAPYWSAEGAVFKVSGETYISLGAYFADAEGDGLSYSVGAAPGLQLSVEGSTLKIVPEEYAFGRIAVPITASDSRKETTYYVTAEII